MSEPRHRRDNKAILGLVAGGLIAGFLAAAVTGYVFVHAPAVRAAEARTEQAQDDLHEAQQATTAVPVDTHCEAVAVGIIDVYQQFRQYLLTQTAKAEADGKHAGFAVWVEENGRVTDLEPYDLDLIVPPRPDLYQTMVETCRVEPERFEIPPGK